MVVSGLELPMDLQQEGQQVGERQEAKPQVKSSRIGYPIGWAARVPFGMGTMFRPGRMLYQICLDTALCREAGKAITPFGQRGGVSLQGFQIGRRVLVLAAVRQVEVLLLMAVIAVAKINQDKNS